MFQQNMGVYLDVIVLLVGVGFAVYFYTAMQRTNSANDTAKSRSSSASYTLKGRFDRVDGLKIDSDVNISGIQIGHVTDMQLDRQTLEAIVTFSIDATIALPIDSKAYMRPEGLLGGYYITILPGEKTTTLAAEDEIATRGSVASLPDLVGSYLLNTRTK